MKRLGTVMHLSERRKLIVRGDEIGSIKDLPRINSVVVDKAVTQIGKVTNIIGPVSHPYISVKIFNGISDSELRSYINERVYVQ
ncbi:MAG: H/ACA RNA-protein complex protein Gar1 [Methanosarcinaceae archaeon]|nr:H/ACA RNA-protein complex protein Gar1 [Methanosarcinaceae archaeon]